MQWQQEEERHRFYESELKWKQEEVRKYNLIAQ